MATGEAPATSTYAMMRDLPASDRPRERLRDRGARALSDAELLAILIRAGTAGQSALAVAQTLLARFDGLEGILRASIRDLCQVKGLGEAKAIEIKAALELADRLRLRTPEERPLVKSPADVARLVAHEMSLLDQEHVRVLVLDARGRLLDKPDVYVGSVHTAVVRMAELLRPAIRNNASSMLVVHNHPSGDPSPSAADVDLTKRLREAAILLDIDLEDHIIVGGGTHVSLREYGLGFDDGR